MPNRDGTYYASAVINVLPEDGDKYQCRVEHASLPQPGLFLWGEPGSVWCVGLGDFGVAPSFPDNTALPQNRSPT